MKKLPLLVTGSVKVSAPYTAITDTEIRKLQYLQSIRQWIDSEAVESIVLIENTGHSIITDELKKDALKKNIKIEEMVYIADQNKIAEFGKGYGEGDAIKFGLNHSEILAGSSHFMKITGRLFIKNIKKILKNWDGKILFNLAKPHFKNHKALDTRFFISEKKFFKTNLMDGYPKVNDHKNYFLEHAYYDCLKNSPIEIGSIKPYPKFSGVSGSTNVKYDEGISKILLKNILVKLGQYKIKTKFETWNS